MLNFHLFIQIVNWRPEPLEMPEESKAFLLKLIKDLISKLQYNFVQKLGTKRSL
jgi:hypothetical protein